jgi:hypothetical protein
MQLNTDPIQGRKVLSRAILSFRNKESKENRGTVEG